MRRVQMMMMIMVIGAIFESEDDFSNGESKTDSTDNYYSKYVSANDKCCPIYKDY